MEIILQQFYPDLVKVLPMNDPVFRSELYSIGLLPGSLKSEIKGMSTRAEKAEHFLDCGINSDIENFQKLITVMEKSANDNVQKLSRNIKDAIESKRKQELRLHIKIPDSGRKPFESEDFNRTIEKYANDNNPLGAFTCLFDNLAELFQQEDFTKLKRSCLLRGVGFSPDFKERMKAATNTEEVLDVLDDFHIYCNWLNIRYLKMIVRNTQMSEAEQLIDSFEKHFYSKKVSEVKGYIDCKSFDPKYVHIIKLKINTGDDNLTVEKLTNYCRELENMGLPEGSVTPTDPGQSGCLLLACAIPLHLCLHAYQMIKLSSFKLRKLHIQFVHVASYAKIYAFPFHVTKESLPVITRIVTHPHQIISHYYTYLEGHMDADSVSHLMQWKLLITDDDYDVITSAPNDMKMNCLILQYVKMMDIYNFLTFLNILKNTERHQIIGEELEALVQETFQCSTASNQDVTGNTTTADSAVLMNNRAWIISSEKSVVYLKFLDLLSKIVELLSSVDVTLFNIAEECRTLLACNDPPISLFTEQYINKLVSCKSPAMLKNLLLPFITWFDHSILRHLILASRSTEGEKSLNRFTSLIDCSELLTIPAPSELIIPLDGSDYTLVATKCDINDQDVTVNQVLDFKKSLLQQWGITEHAIQLVAMHVAHNVLYWMIPESITPLVTCCTGKQHYQLKQSGIISSAVLSKQSLYDEQKRDMMQSSLFCFLDTNNDLEHTFLQRQLLDIDRNTTAQHLIFNQTELKSVSQQYSELQIQYHQLQEELSDLQSYGSIDQLKSDFKKLSSKYQALKSNAEAKVKKDSTTTTTSTATTTSTTTTIRTDISIKKDISISDDNTSEINSYTDSQEDFIDITHLMNTISIIKSHWYVIGTKLNIAEELLKKFWEEASDVDILSKNVYCCCKMLAYWHSEAKDVTVKNFLNTVCIGPLGLDTKRLLIKNMLIGESSDKVNSDTSPYEIDEVEKSYALMISKVIAIIGKDVSIFRDFLDHCKSSLTNKCKIDKKIYENATTFSDLVKVLESNGFITHTELSWLKHLVVKDVIFGYEALNEIKKYEELYIAHKLRWHSWSKGTYPHGSLLMVKTNLDPASLSGSAISKTKSAIAKMASVDETDILLHSASVGSVIIFWKLSSCIKIELPKAITPSCEELCYNAGITQVGTVYKQKVTLNELHQFKTDSSFPQDLNIDQAYYRLTSNINILLKNLKFEQLQQACVKELCSLGGTLSKNLVLKVQQTRSFYSMLDVLNHSLHWNWFDMKLLEALVNASGSAKAEEWLQSFKAAYHSKKLADLIPYIKTKPISGFTVLVEKFNKNFRDITISELLQHKHKLEYEVLAVDKGELVLSCVKTSCLGLTWFIPQELVYKAFISMKKKRSEYPSLAIKSLICESAEEYAGLAYLWHGQEIKEVGPIEPLPEYIRKEPYSLPKGFQWAPLTSGDIQEIVSFMCKNPNLSSQYKFYFSYPNSKSDWQFAIRTTKGTLVGVVLATPVRINIRGKLIQCVCPIIKNHKKYNDKRIWFMLHKELQRRTNLYKINQFVYCGNHDLLKPFLTFTKWYIQFPDSDYELFCFTVTRGWRKMTSEDIPSALALVNKHSSQFEIGTVFTAEEFSHNFLCTTIPNYVFTYIVENDNNITDLVSYNFHPGYFPQADVTAVVSTHTPLQQLLHDMLVSARNNGVEQVSILQHNIGRDLLLSLGFLPDQFPCEPLYVFNYQFSEVSEADCFYPL